MISYVFDIGDKGRKVGRFIGRVRAELQRAFADEKKTRKLSQQAIADKLGVNRSVVNRQLNGIENLTLRTVAELAWAMDWDLEFKLSKKFVDGGNYFIPAGPPPSFFPQRTMTATSNTSPMITLCQPAR